MLNFTILGIPVRIEPWFWITMVIIGGGFYAMDARAWLFVGVFVLAGLISILIHELGHALTIRKYGLPTAITLTSFGGYASYPANRLDRKASFKVTAAGPAFQMLAGLLVLGLRGILPIPEESLLAVLVINFIFISIVWAIFNCLPIYPMDGGHMLAAILGPGRQRAVFLTGFLLALLIAVGAFMVLGSWLISMVMALLAWKNWSDMQNMASNR